MHLLARIRPDQEPILWFGLIHRESAPAEIKWSDQMVKLILKLYL